MKITSYSSVNHLLWNSTC